MSPVGVTRLQNIRDPVVNLSGRKLEISHDTIVVDFQANDGKPDGLPDDVRLGGTFPSSRGRQPDDLVSVQMTLVPPSGVRLVGSPRLGPCRPMSWCGNCATFSHMTTVASRDLRNHTADVLRQVQAGTKVTITVNGTPVAEISPVRSARQQFLSKADLLEITTLRQADPGLRDDLDALAGDTTDDLDAL